VRSRWCCGAIVWLLLEIYELQVSRETVRRWLYREQLVWRRSRPIVGPTDPEREAKLKVRFKASVKQLGMENIQGGPKSV
jgi:putative transposase